MPHLTARRVRSFVARRLRGPLVERGRFGPVVRASKEFTVGANAREVQLKREREALAELEAICDKCESIFRKVEAARSNPKLDRADWAALTKRLLDELQGYRKQLQGEPRPAVAVTLGFAAGHLATIITEANPFATHPDPNLGPFERKEYQASIDGGREALRERREQLDAEAARLTGKPGKKP